MALHEQEPRVALRGLVGKDELLSQCVEPISLRCNDGQLARHLLGALGEQVVLCLLYTSRCV